MKNSLWTKNMIKFNNAIYIALALICLLVVLVFIIVSVLYLLILSKSFLKASKRADCIIVPGAKISGLSLALRIKKANELYNKNYASKIIVTGGTRKEYKSITEAKYMQGCLINLGVNSSDIILEENALTTFDNFKHCKTIMDKMGYKSAIITTNTYHAFRCENIAKDFDIDYQIEVAPKEKGIFIKPLIREVLVAFRYYILRIR